MPAFSELAYLALLVLAVARADPAHLQRAPRPVDHSAFDRILQKTVRDGRVDYLAIRDRYWEPLQGYLSHLAQVHAAELAREEQLAFYINLYNAAMIRAVIERLRVGYTPADDSWSVFDKPLVPTASGVLSLNRLEHEILRPRFGEPRIHVALVCAAESCPPLLPRAYRGEELDQVLEENMRRFLNDTTRNPIDRAGGRLRLSKIFDWYAADFGGRGALARYVSRYLPFDAAGFELAFADYSWKLNWAPPDQGRWMAVTAERAPLRTEPGGGEAPRSAVRGEIFEVLEERDGWRRARLPFSSGEAWIDAGTVAPFSP
ncbi:MAG: DUF547 domain-containing protein [Planctomycetota bacterium]